MRKITKVFNSILFLSFVLIITNCTSNDLADESNVQSSTEAKNWYDRHKEDYNSTVLKYAEDLQWEKAIISEGKNGEVIEVPFTLEGRFKTSNKNGALYNDSHRLMFLKSGAKDFKIYYVQIFADNKNSSILDKEYSYYNVSSDFEGKVFIQDLLSKSVNKLEFKDGRKVNPSLTGKMREEAYDCVYLGYWYEDGHFEAIELLYCEGIGDSDEQPIGGGGGGTSSGTEGANLTMPPPPDVPISDIKKFLSCFSTSTTANLTVYAETMGGGNGVGHAFIGLSQGSNSAVYGYYPKTAYMGSLSGQGIMGENGGHHYNVSADFSITGEQLSRIIALSEVYQSNWYDLSFNNCSDFATEVLNIAGVSTSGVIDTPDTVAAILYSRPNYIITTANAPNTNRTCQ